MIVARGLGRNVVGETALYGIIATFGLGIDGNVVVVPPVTPIRPSVPMNPYPSVFFNVRTRSITVEGF